MRLWIDCEWNDYKGELISMALVAEDRRQWYACLECINPSPWIQMNVMPILDGAVITREQMQSSLARFLNYFDSVHVIADWPEDIQHFCEILIVGPGMRLNTPPLTMEVRRDINSDGSKRLHNALSDATAMRAMHLAMETMTARSEGE